MNSIIIFVKYPTPGKVKTRLGAEIGYQAAAELYHLFMALTFQLVQKAFSGNIFVACEPQERLEDIKFLLPEKFHCFPQEGRDLGQRILHSIQYVVNCGANKIVIIGSDSPTFPSHFIGDAFNRLDTRDLVLGPAQDGGYYLIGLKRAHRELFETIPWSSSEVLQTTTNRALEAGLTFSLLPEWYDVDGLNNLKRAANDDISGKIKAYLQKYTKTLTP
ncbi:MAG: TIGR04282 family arsenosugar biosynthesis glycosyltransferase [bacterium]